MKKCKCYVIFFIIIVLMQFSSFIIVEAVDINKEYKLIEIIEKDTTGKGYKDKIKILADEKNSGYSVEIEQFKGKTYRLKSKRENYKYLAPYTIKWKLNIRVVDINNDKIPEIIIWGDGTHERDTYIFEWNGYEYKIIFYGFYEGFYFEDITGDNILTNGIKWTRLHV